MIVITATKEISRGEQAYRVNRIDCPIEEELPIEYMNSDERIYLNYNKTELRYQHGTVAKIGNLYNRSEFCAIEEKINQAINVYEKIIKAQKKKNADWKGEIKIGR
jgi:hypothetical protein